MIYLQITNLQSSTAQLRLKIVVKVVFLNDFCVVYKFKKSIKCNIYEEK